MRFVSHIPLSRPIYAVLVLIVAGWVLSACSESLTEAEILASATARAYERQTLEAQRDSLGTRAPETRPPLAYTTPNLNATAVEQVRELLTLTALNWTDTPTATLTATPDLNATAQALIFERWTATATSWTATPTPDLDATVRALAAGLQSGSATPDFEATAEALLAQRLTATAERWTDTPTPNLDATIDAMVAAAMTVTAASWTATPSATPSPTPAAITDTPTPDYDATVQALVEGALSGSATPAFTGPPDAAALAAGMPAQGPDGAPVLLVAVLDPQCTDCLTFHRDIQPSLIATYPGSLRIAYRLAPILGEDSVRASQAMACADDQGLFWDMMDAVADAREADASEPLSRADLIRLAGALDLDLVDFVTCLSDRARRETVEQAGSALNSLGIAEIPTYVINDVSLDHTAILTDFQAVIDALLAIAAPNS